MRALAPSVITMPTARYVSLSRINRPLRPPDTGAGSTMAVYSRYRSRRYVRRSVAHTELVIAIAELPSWNRRDSLNAALANVVTPTALHRILLTAGEIAADGETA